MRKKLGAIRAALRARKTKATTWLRAHALDIVGSAGIASLALGAGLVFAPAGLIVLGVLLLAVSIGGERA